MKKVLITFFILAFSLPIIGCKQSRYADFQGSGTAEDKDRPLAFVGNDTITLLQFNRGLNDHGWHRADNLDTMNFKKKVLRDQIVNICARTKAHDYPLVIDQDLKDRLEDHLNSVLRSQLFEEKIKSQINISEEDVKEAYDKNLDKFAVPARANVAHILFSNYRPYLEKKYGIDDSATAEDLDEHARARLNMAMDELKKGRSYEELAREFSDDTVSGLKGGEYGFINKGDAETAFDSVAFSLPIGEISGPVKTKYGYHLVRVLEREEPTHRPLDSNLTDAIRKELESMKTRELATAYFDSLVKTLEITYNEEFIKNMDSTFERDYWVSVIDGKDTVYAWVYYNLENREKARDPRIKIDSLVRRELLQQLSYSWLLIFDAIRNGYDQTPKYEESREDFIYKEKLSKVMSERFSKDYEPSEEECLKYFEEHKDDFVDDSAVSIQQVILENKRTAMEVKRRADSGANFYQVAMEYFPGEEEEIKKMAINLGWITPEEISRDFFNKVFRLDAGEISKPIKTKWGYHIVKVLAKKGVPSFDNVRSEIRKILVKENERKAKERWEERMMDGIEIRVDTQLLSEFIFHKEWLPKPDFSKMFPQY